jgi:hypothetical protein
MTPLFAIVLGFTDFAIIAWLIIIFAGAASFSSRKSADLRRVERKLDVLLKRQGVFLPQDFLSEEVQRLARDPAQKFAAMKLHREQTGLGLAEAKADIEEYIKSIAC